MEKKEVINVFLDRGYLPSPDFFELNEVDVDGFLTSFTKKISSKDKPVVLNKDFISIIDSKKRVDVNWVEFDKSRVMFEKGKNKNVYKTFLDLLYYESDKISKRRIDSLVEDVKKPEEDFSKVIEKDEMLDSNIILINNYQEDCQKREVKDFVSYFKVRYNFLKGVLQQRPELQNVVSINRALRKDNMEQVSIIGLVYDKRITANGNIFLQLEDVTGSIKVLINQNRKELFSIGEKICLDEVIGIIGSTKNKFIFSTNVLFPDIPTTNKSLKRCEDDINVAFISDTHFGSVDFLEEKFLKFIEWINGKYGSEDQRKLAKKVKYLFVVGDIVDGVGVYPGQDKDLNIKDIYEQYKFAYEMFSKIREDVKIIICPGQHDAVRTAEPQLAINERYAKDLCGLPNIISVSNPSFVNIHSSKNFEGFNLMMYHGASFHYYVDNLPLLYRNNARDNPKEILQILLQKRHLAPSHSSTTYVPFSEEDPLLIKKIPDIIVAGDMHKSDLSTYNGVVIINSSCWQSKTDFQEKTGNNPDPCKVPLFNLKTREIRVMDFSGDKL